MPDDEDPDLREAMDVRLLDLCDDDDLVGSTVGWSRSRVRPTHGCEQVLAAVAALAAD